MGTTNLFVELVVIGAGVLIWVVLLALSIFGLPLPIVADTLLVAAALPTLAVIYVAGIILDRVADNLFERLWLDGWRQDFFPKKFDYYQARRVVLTKSDRISELLEYGRSRMRICRAWTINSVMIATTLTAFTITNYANHDQFNTLLLVIAIFGLAFTYGSWSAWAGIARTEFRKVKEQAAYLQNEN